MSASIFIPCSNLSLSLSLLLSLTLLPKNNRVYDTRRMVEVGTLMLHEGTVTSVAFFGGTHMLSGGEDGGVCIWNAKTWDNLKVLRGHRGRVNDLAIHPSGRLAVSVGRDRTLRTWDLLKGRPAFTSARRTAAQCVLWTECGRSVILAENKAVQVLSLSEGGPTCSLEPGFWVGSMTLLRHGRLAVAGHDPDIHIYDVEAGGAPLVTVSGHTTRVKSLAVSRALGPAAEELLVSGDSEGVVKVWAVGEDSVGKYGEARVQGRITGLAIALPDTKKSNKKRQSRPPPVKRGGGGGGGGNIPDSDSGGLGAAANDEEGAAAATAFAATLSKRNKKRKKTKKGQQLHQEDGAVKKRGKNSKSTATATAATKEPEVPPPPSSRDKIKNNSSGGGGGGGFVEVSGQETPSYVTEGLPAVGNASGFSPPASTPTVAGKVRRRKAKLRTRVAVEGGLP